MKIHGANPARPSLVLLHGGGDTIRTSFGDILPELARDRQVIAFEQQGYITFRFAKPISSASVMAVQSRCWSRSDTRRWFASWWWPLVFSAVTELIRDSGTALR
jgi:hypothetical protein